MTPVTPVTPTDPAYVELHLHTAFSFLDGASLPEELISRAAELGYQALAITDHDGLYGAMEFAQAARAAGIQPITGAELTLADDSHLTLLAKTAKGYNNLCRLITSAHRDGPDASLMNVAVASRGAEAPTLTEISRLKPAGTRDWAETPFVLSPGGASSVQPGPSAPGVAAAPPQSATISPTRPPRIGGASGPPPQLDPALLPEYAGGLILLTGCRRGQLAQLIDAVRLPEAEALLRRYVAWFGKENVVVELQQTLTYGDTQRIALLVQLAERLGLRYAATGNVHYHRRERHRLQDTLVAIRTHTTLDGAHRARRANAEFFLKSAEEMTALFARYPTALATTLDIAERCADFDLTRHLNYAFPDYKTDPGETPDDRLSRICRKELLERYPDEEHGITLEAAEKRLNEELRLIAHHKLAGFFLLYRDILDLAREVAAEVRGISAARAASGLPPGRGRGSSVSSIVCYLIGLSPVDPLAYDLFLGRFLNEEIRSVPDIDLDFPREIRERLIERVYEVYGADHAALVCAFATYKLRSAVRDVGKALGLPLPDLDKIAKLSESHSLHKLGEELSQIPTYAARKDAPPWTHLVELAGQLAGFPRHVTQHVGGMIIASKPLIELVPVQPAAMPGRYICQWDKDSCDDARFIKIDFLALGMLSLVEECLELIVHAGKPPVDLSRINFDDKDVYEMICAGDTIGVFQIESRAQIQMLPRTQPTCLDHLVVQVAIVRPGPIVGGAVNPYVRHRKQELDAERRGTDRFQPTYDHPLLEDVLADTLGVILYQEQVVEVAMKLAGFTAGQAELLRRAMSRKRSYEAMVELQDQFLAGASDKGVPPDVAKKVFEKLLGFAQFGFPKSHAAAFAVLAYQSAWLRLHHLAEFTCALFNNQPMGFYPPHVLTNDAKRHGLRVLSPHINRSGARCTVEEEKTVRIGFGYVSGLGEEAALLIEHERATNGPYRSLADFVRRVPLRFEATAKSPVNLIMIGAFDDFGLGRREALWQLGLFVPPRRLGRPSAAVGAQLSLDLPVAQDMVALRPTTAWERMAADYDVLKLSPHYHPLGLLRPRLPKSIQMTKELAYLPDGLIVQVAGLVVCRQRPGTAKGITFLLLEDEFGLVNVVVYPALDQEERLVVRTEPFLLVEGKLQRREGTINVIAQAVAPLGDARRAFVEGTPPEIGSDLPIPEPDRAPTDDLRPVMPSAHNYR